MPTISSLLFQNVTLYFFYFTNGTKYISLFLKGNATGKGSQREQELQNLMNHLKIHHSHLFILHDPRIQDGMQEKWNITICQKYLEEFIYNKSITEVRTFDSKGVSGHPNHISTFTAVCSIRKKFKDILFLTLYSTSLLSKYSGPLLLLPVSSKQDEVFVSSNPFLTHQLFLLHKSQITWYRIAFTLISRYSYQNNWNDCP